MPLHFVRQTDGYAVTTGRTPAGKELGTVGRDGSRWWARQQVMRRSDTGTSASLFYVSGLRTRAAAANALATWAGEKGSK